MDDAGRTVATALGPDWPRLLTFANRLASEQGDSLVDAMESIGLLLEEEPSGPWDYGATPSCSVTFASTGGDGVHYGVVLSPDGPGPVVMTVPMSFDRPNVVVGENLRDFLRLGCEFGYFGLASLADRWNEVVAQIEQSQGSDALLRGLRRELSLERIRSVGAHLDDLARRFDRLLPRRGDE